MTLVCTVVVQGRTVELLVEGAETCWRWSLRTVDGSVLRDGAMTTQPAAQVASQLAFESRLQEAGLNHFIPNRYNWKERTPED